MNLEECLFDAVPGPYHEDAAVTVLSLWDRDLGGSVPLELLQLGATLPQKETVVLLRDVDRGASLSCNLM